MELFEESEHVRGGGASQAIALASFGLDGGVAPEDFGVDLGFRVSPFLHRSSHIGETDLVEHEVGGRVVGVGDHEVGSGFQRDLGADLEVIGQDAGAGYFV